MICNDICTVHKYEYMICTSNCTVQSLHVLFASDASKCFEYISSAAQVQVPACVAAEPHQEFAEAR